MGLTNIEALERPTWLADKQTPRQFAELAGLDYEAAQGRLRRPTPRSIQYMASLRAIFATYKVPLIDHVSLCSASRWIPAS